MNPSLRALRPYPMAELQARKADLKARGQRLFDFGTGDPIEPTSSIITEAIKAAIPTVSQYPTVAGTPAFRDTVSAYLKRRFDVTIDSCAILPSAGSKEAIFHLPLAIIDPASDRRVVIYGTPAYPVYETGALFAGGVAQPINLPADQGFRLDLTAQPAELLDRTAIAWINYPHNPTGACVDRNYLDEQAACARDHGILLASDECYTDLWFSGAEPPPSLLQVEHSSCLVFNSCSKRSGMTGYRSGFIAGDATLIATYRRWRSTMGVGSPTFTEAAAKAAWGDDVHPVERRRVFTAKRDLLVAGLRERGIEVLPSDAGLYIWARTPTGFDDDAWAARCLDAGIIISPGGFFGAGGQGFFRLALVPSLADCEAALAAWPAVC